MPGHQQRRVGRETQVHARRIATCLLIELRTSRRRSAQFKHADVDEWRRVISGDTQGESVISGIRNGKPPERHDAHRITALDRDVMMLLVNIETLLHSAAAQPALRLKNGRPSAADLRSKRSSSAQFFCTDAMPFSAAAFVSYCSLRRMTSAFPALSGQSHNSCATFCHMLAHSFPPLEPLVSGDTR